MFKYSMHYFFSMYSHTLTSTIIHIQTLINQLFDKLIVFLQIVLISLLQ